MPPRTRRATKKSDSSEATHRCGTVPEIVERTLFYVDEKADLANCALVCQLWLPIAVREMWSSVELVDTNSPQLLAYKKLRPAVQDLLRPQKMVVSGLDVAHLQDLRPATAIIKKIVPAVRRLKLGPDSFEAFLPAIAVLVGERLTELDVFFDRPRSSVEWGPVLLENCPNLRALAFRGVDDHMVLPNLSRCSVLRRLEIASTRLFGWAFPPRLYRQIGRTKSLRFLTLDRDDECNAEKVASLEGLTGLESLRLLDVARRWHEELNPLLVAIGTGLTYLEITNIVADADAAEDILDVMPGALRSLCPALTNAGVEFEGRGINVYTVIKFLEALDGLESLAIGPFNQRPKPDDAVALRDCIADHKSVRVSLLPADKFQRVWKRAGIKNHKRTWDGWVQGLEEVN